MGKTETEALDYRRGIFSIRAGHLQMRLVACPCHHRGVGFPLHVCSIDPPQPSDLGFIPASSPCHPYPWVRPIATLATPTRTSPHEDCRLMRLSFCTMASWLKEPSCLQMPQGWVRVQASAELVLRA